MHKTESSLKCARVKVFLEDIYLSIFKKKIVLRGKFEANRGKYKEAWDEAMRKNAYLRYLTAKKRKAC